MQGQLMGHSRHTTSVDLGARLLVFAKIVAETNGDRL